MMVLVVMLVCVGEGGSNARLGGDVGNDGGERGGGVIVVVVSVVVL